MPRAMHDVVAPLALAVLLALLSPGHGLVAQQRRVAADLSRGDENVRIRVKDDKGKELHLEARASTRLSRLMDVVCRRLGLEKEYAKFSYGGRQLSAYDTVDEFGLRSDGVIEVQGGSLQRSGRHEARLNATQRAEAAEKEVAAQAAAAAAAAEAAKARVPKITTFAIGDFAYVNVAQDAGSANNWAPCSISGKGSESDTYNIHFMFSPAGLRDATGVPWSMLRKVDGRRYAEAIQYYREDEEAASQAQLFVRERQKVQQASQEAATVAKAAAAEQARVAAAAAEAQRQAEEQRQAEDEEAKRAAAVANSTYVSGDFLLMKVVPRGNTTAAWMPCRLIGNGALNDSYRVKFNYAPAGHGDITNVTKDLLRKVDAKRFADASKEVKRDTGLAQQLVLQLEEEAAERLQAALRAREEAELARKKAEAEAKAAALAAKKAAEAAAKLKAEQAAKALADGQARREKEAAKRKAEEEAKKKAASTEYLAGQYVFVKLDKTVKGTSALPCLVKEPGNEQYTYLVHCDFGPTGHQDLRSVPSAYLQPADAGHHAKAAKQLAGDAARGRELMEQAEREAGRHERAKQAERKAAAGGKAAPAAVGKAAPAAAAAKPSPKPLLVLKEGDFAEVRIDKAFKDTRHAPCAVVGKGSKPNTYNVRFLFASPKHKQDVADIPVESMQYRNKYQADEANKKFQGDAELADLVMGQVEREAGRRQRAELALLKAKK